MIEIYVVTAVTVKVAAFWNVTLCRLVDRRLPAFWRNSSMLLMEALCSAETPVMLYQTSIFRKAVIFKLRYFHRVCCSF
jgi:hypothetical protein